MRWLELAGTAAFAIVLIVSFKSWRDAGSNHNDQRLVASIFGIGLVVAAIGLVAILSTVF